MNIKETFNSVSLKGRMGVGGGRKLIKHCKNAKVEPAYNNYSFSIQHSILTEN